VPVFFPALSAMLFLPYFVRLVLLSRGADSLVQATILNYRCYIARVSLLLIFAFSDTLKMRRSKH
jgi:hypothetical protein